VQNRSGLRRYTWGQNGFQERGSSLGQVVWDPGRHERYIPRERVKSRLKILLLSKRQITIESTWVLFRITLPRLKSFRSVSSLIQGMASLRQAVSWRLCKNKLGVSFRACLENTSYSHYCGIPTSVAFRLATQSLLPSSTASPSSIHVGIQRL
jgi:hypothetical protein